MASLTNSQIDLTYGGLLKTDNNSAITGEIGITDGLGNSAGFAVNPGYSELKLTGNGTDNPRFTLTNSSANPSWVGFPVTIDTASGFAMFEIKLNEPY